MMNYDQIKEQLTELKENAAAMDTCIKDLGHAILAASKAVQDAFMKWEYAQFAQLAISSQIDDLVKNIQLPKELTHKTFEGITKPQLDMVYGIRKAHGISDELMSAALMKYGVAQEGDLMRAYVQQYREDLLNIAMNVNPHYPTPRYLPGNILNPSWEKLHQQSSVQ